MSSGRTKYRDTDANEEAELAETTDYEFWLWDQHGLIRRKRDSLVTLRPEIWRSGHWEDAGPYALDAIIGMGEDPYSCGEWAHQLSLDDAREYAAANGVDLLGSSEVLDRH